MSLEYSRDHPEVDVVYGHRVIIDEYDAEIGRWVMPPHDDEYSSGLIICLRKQCSGAVLSGSVPEGTSMLQ